MVRNEHLSQAGPTCAHCGDLFILSLFMFLFCEKRAYKNVKVSVKSICSGEFWFIITVPFVNFPLVFEEIFQLLSRDIIEIIVHN